MSVHSDVVGKIDALGEALFVLSGKLVDVRFFEGKGNGEAYERAVEAFGRLRDAVDAGGVE